MAGLGVWRAGLRLAAHTEVSLDRPPCIFPGFGRRCAARSRRSRVARRGGGHERRSAHPCALVPCALKKAVIDQAPHRAEGGAPTNSGTDFSRGSGSCALAAMHRLIQSLSRRGRRSHKLWHRLFKRQWELRPRSDAASDPKPIAPRAALPQAWAGLAANARLPSCSPHPLRRGVRTKAATHPVAGWPAVGGCRGARARSRGGRCRPARRCGRAASPQSARPCNAPPASRGR